MRDAGFNDRQANALAQKFEETAHAQGEDLKDFIRSEFDRRFESMEARMDTRFSKVNEQFSNIDSRFAQVDVQFAEMGTKIEAVRAELHSSLRDQMLKFITILVAVVSVAVAVIKLFPDLH